MSGCPIGQTGVAGPSGDPIANADLVTKALVIGSLEELLKTVRAAGAEEVDDAMELANDLAFNSEKYATALEYCLRELSEKSDD